MENKKLVKKALRLQLLMRLAIKLKPARVGTERLVGTSHGNVRVLEYGFDSSETAPLFIDMHGGWFCGYGRADVRLFQRTSRRKNHQH